jgi:hypothetical protein
VIKSVAYFPLQCAQNSTPVIAAMLNSLRSAGIATIENSLDADAVIVWSVLWSGRMAANKQVYEHYRAQDKPVIVVDVGALYRGETWKIAVNHINRLGYYGHTENLNMDRPRKLGISLAVNFSRNPAVLIAAQHRHSLQLANQNHEAWVMEQVDAIRQVSDRPIVIRPHPRSPLEIDDLDKTITVERPQKIADTYDSYNMHFDYHAVVNYCSGPGIQAAISGTRPVVGTYSLASPVSVKIENLDQPYNTDRDQWLVEICHTEYTVKEIQQGLWLRRLSSHL